ncbi:MAG: hypothetical protein ACXVEE_15630 [Polyangiales bacterium]
MRLLSFLAAAAALWLGCSKSDSSGTSGDTTDGGGPGPVDSGPPPSGTGPRGLFPADHFFYKDVSALPASDQSSAILGTLGKWGNGGVFQIDFSITVLYADKSTPTIKATSIDSPGDSDDVPFPFPTGGALEDEDGYACTKGGDCHLLVIQQDTRKLYEAWATNLMGTMLTFGSTAVWDLDKHYGPEGRGLGCTSADAAGFPIVPGLIGVDEVAAEDIQHALRFILPNPSMRRMAWVPPATHYGAPSNMSTSSIPYGTRLRLKASFDEASIKSKGGRAVVRALKKYGMLLSDGGQIALTAESDRFTKAKWVDNGGSADLKARDLSSIQPADFEVVDFGTVNQAYPIDQAKNEWPDCVRAK